jgi:SAM-dependent methyltransferase
MPYRKTDSVDPSGAFEQIRCLSTVRPTDAASVLDALGRRFAPPDGEEYVRTHRRRYALLLELVGGFAPQTILVVGPSYESALLREAFPDATVNTLGWYDHRFPLREGEQHTDFDLNEREYPQLEPHDLIVCGEVVEHLHVSPLPVLRFLAGVLSPEGRLVLQTPNATALPKRLRMLIGRNPYAPIRDEPRNPGHFHEYTIRELRDLLEAAGLEILRLITANYFDHGSPQNRLYRAVGPVLPGTLREGITVVARSSR